MVKAGDAFKAGCFGAMGVWFFFAVVPVIGLVIFFVVCGGLGAGLRKGVDQAKERQNERGRGGVAIQPAADAGDRAEQARIDAFAREAREREQQQERDELANKPDRPEPEIAQKPVETEEERIARERAEERLAEKQRKAEAEKQAQTQLKAAKSLMSANKKAAQDRLRSLIEKWPDTDAAKEARRLLK